MSYSIKPPLILPLLFFLTSFVSVHVSLAHDSDSTAIRERRLMSIKEMPAGGNVTFDCSPSGPCIPCSRSEKSDEKFRCGETGYRIRLKCVPSGSGSKDAKGLNGQKKRSTLEFTDAVNQQDVDATISSTRQTRLLGDSSKSEGGLRAYVTYRSCIPAVNEERLSVIGFETLMLALLLGSGSFIYLRRKRSIAAAGGAPVRLPTNSRF